MKVPRTEDVLKKCYDEYGFRPPFDRYVSASHSVRTWFDEFRKEAHETTSPTELAHSFVMLAPIDREGSSSHWSNHTAREYARSKFDETDWIHLNQRFVNSCAWWILKESGMLAKVRRVILNDSRRQDSVIADLQYAYFLLDNFLLASPNKDLVDTTHYTEFSY